eukprot:scaffold30680_cov21-Tisochrysis_lutea.AAC.1
MSLPATARPCSCCTWLRALLKATPHATLHAAALDCLLMQLLETYTNLGPIIDFCVVDLDRQGQGQGAMTGLALYLHKSPVTSVYAQVHKQAPLNDAKVPMCGHEHARTHAFTHTGGDMQWCSV